MANDKDRLFEKIYFLWKGEGERRLRLRVTEREQPEHRLVLRSELCSRAPKEATYGANVEEYRKWYQGISKSVKEVQIVGSHRSSSPPLMATRNRNRRSHH